MEDYKFIENLPWHSWGMRGSESPLMIRRASFRVSNYGPRGKGDSSDVEVNRCSRILSCRLGVNKMDKPRPYICAALFCENVLEEKNGSLTIVRIADRLEYEVHGLPEDAKPTLNLKGLLALKSGPVQGDCNVTITINRPNGKQGDPIIFPAFKLLGGDQGQNVILNISLGVNEEGLHWFDVNFNGELLTRIPLMVVQRPKPEREKSQ